MSKRPWRIQSNKMIIIGLPAQTMFASLEYWPKVCKKNFLRQAVFGFVPVTMWRLAYFDWINVINIYKSSSLGFKAIDDKLFTSLCSDQILLFILSQFLNLSFILK